jgi:hypothetical protein
LHDALYVEYPSNDLSKVDLMARCMIDAFKFYFEDKEGAGLVRLDADIWSPDYPSEQGYVDTPGGIPCKRQQQYIDERSVNEFNKFKKYFT